MNDILTDAAREVSRKLAADQDALIRRCVSARIGDSWTDADIIPRLRWETEPGEPGKLLFLDDEPLLRIWPPQCHTETEGNKSVMKWTVTFQDMT